MADAITLRSHADAALISDFRTRGFAAVADLAEPALVAEARAQFFAFMRAQAGFLGLPTDGPEDDWAWTVFNDARVRGKLYELSQGLAACHRLAFDARVLAVCRALGVQVPLLRNTTLRIDFPADDRVLQPAHQDIRGIRARRCLNFWLPLQPVDPRTGGLTVFDGSHAAGPIMPDKLNVSGYQVIEREKTARYPELKVTMAPGQALVFDPCLVHESTPNRGNRARLTWVFRFDDGADIDWLERGQFELSRFDIQVSRGGTKA